MNQVCPVTFDADFLADPAASYARLREQGPVHRAATPDGSPVWLVTRYADVRALLADPRLSVDRAHSRNGYVGFSLPPALDANLLNLDPPVHTRVRALTGKAFTPRNTERFRPRIQEIADELADDVAEALNGPGGVVDLMALYAAPLPIRVICEILGVAEADRMRFKAWTDEMFAPTSPEHTKQAIAELHDFLISLVAAKRSSPGDDLLSTLTAVRDDEDRLSEDELTSAAFGILLGGYENSVNLLGNGILALLTHPRQREAIQADPGRLPATVDEMLRFESPSQLAIRRFPREDIVVGGTTIPAGDTVLLSLASAHHDPQAFTDPGNLDLDRGSNPHLAFGHGPHYCVGASLARAEAEIGIATVLDRFPGLRLATSAEELDWRPSFRHRGLRTLPVTR